MTHPTSTSSKAKGDRQGARPTARYRFLRSRPRLTCDPIRRVDHGNRGRAQKVADVNDADGSVETGAALGDSYAACVADVEVVRRDG